MAQRGLEANAGDILRGDCQRFADGALVGIAERIECIFAMQLLQDRRKRAAINANRAYGEGEDAQISLGQNPAHALRLDIR